LTRRLSQTDIVIEILPFVFILVGILLLAAAQS
jgi:hypothetical protein